MKSRRVRTPFRFTPYNVGRAAYSVGRFTRKAVDWWKGSNKKTTGSGVTSQFDRKVQYRKKNMPRRKKKQWIKFAKKVNAVALKDFATKTIVRNSQLGVNWATDDQEFLTITIYGKDGQADTVSALSKGNDDLKQIFANDPDLLDASSSGHFTAGVLDLTICNNSFAADSAENTGMEVDVYEIMYTKMDDYPSATSMITRAQTNTGQINGAVASLTLVQRGVTPFDFPDASSNGFKILKKTKYFLGRGQTATYQYRDPKNYQFRQSFINNDDDNFAIRKVTRTLMVVAKGVPTATPTAVTKRINIGATRNYKYKILKDNIDEDNYLP